MQRRTRPFYEIDTLEGFVHEGEEAFKAGLKLLDNPYPLGSQAANRWRIGWEIQNRVSEVPR